MGSSTRFPLPPPIESAAVVALVAIYTDGGGGIWVLVGPTVVAAGFLVASRTRSRRYQARAAGYAAACVGVVVGFLVASQVTDAMQEGSRPGSVGVPVDTIVQMRVTLRQDSSRRADGSWSAWGRVERSCARFACVSSDAKIFLTGDGLNDLPWGAQLSIEETPVLLGDSSDGVFFASVSAAADVVIPASAARFRFRIHRLISSRTATWSAEARGVFLALFLGNRNELPPALYDQVRRAGGAHVLALSGMHLGLVAGAILLLLKRVPKQVLAKVIVCIFSVLYLLLAGIRPSLLRAVLMLHIAVLFRYTEGQVPPLRVLALTFLLHSLLRPEDVYSLGFVLSFSALLGIFALSGVLMYTVPGRLPRSLRAVIAAGIAAQVATAPFAYIHFGEVYPIGALSSILFTPLSAVAIASGLCGLVPGLIGTGGQWFLERAVDGIEALSAVASAARPIRTPGVLLAWLGFPAGLLASLHLRYHAMSRCLRSFPIHAMTDEFYRRLDNSPSALRDYLKEQGLAAGKRFGQNFMVCPEIRAALVDSFGDLRDRHVWEVGPGLGAMTDLLLEAGAYVTAFEIDHGFIRHLDARFGAHPRFSVLAGDCLETIPEYLSDSAGAGESGAPESGAPEPGVPGAGVPESGARPDAVLGNLPYNVAAHIIWLLLERDVGARELVLTVQREVADRMVATEATRVFGPLSVLCAADHTIRRLRAIPGECFYPRPNVTSTAVRLERVRTMPPQQKAALLAVTDAAFATRRKTLLNNLSSKAGGRVEAERRIRAAGLDPGIRAEALTHAALSRLAEQFAELSHDRISS